MTSEKKATSAGTSGVVLIICVFGLIMIGLALVVQAIGEQFVQKLFY